MGAIGTFLPLILFFSVVGIAAYYGYQVYLYTSELAARGAHKLEKKNVLFSKEGMKVGVKDVRPEDYEDRTQRAFVKAWDYAKEDKRNASSKSRVQGQRATGTK